MDDDLEVNIAAGLDVPTAIVLADKPDSPDKPGRSGCLCVLIGLVILLWTIAK
jgi:hypothetical protein